MAAYTLRIPDELMHRLKAHHRRTFPAHGLSFNAWMCRRLARWLRARPVYPPRDV